MNDVLIYGGVIVNVIGALYLIIGFGLMILGGVIAIIGYYI